MGTPVSVIGLGTWQFGSSAWGYGTEYEERSSSLVRRALDSGITLVDTAEIYGRGRSERLVGAALAERRAEAVVATKIFPVLPIAPVSSSVRSPALRAWASGGWTCTRCTSRTQWSPTPGRWPGCGRFRTSAWWTRSA